MLTASTTADLKAVTKVSFVAVSRSITISTDAQITSWNSGKAVGFDDWDSGVAKSNKGLNYDGTVDTTAYDTNYDI